MIIESFAGYLWSAAKLTKALQALRISIAKFEVILTDLPLYVSSVPSYDKNDLVKHAG